MASQIFIINGRTTIFNTSFGINSTGYARVTLDSVDITNQVEIDGVEDGSQSIRVTVPIDIVQDNVDAELGVFRVDNVDPNSPEDSLIVDIGRNPGGIDPVALHLELIHHLQLIGDLGGGIDTSFVGLGDAFDRLNTIAGILFNDPSFDGGGYWDGTDEASDTFENALIRIGNSETTITDHENRITQNEGDIESNEGRITTNEEAIEDLGDQVQTGVGLPAPVVEGAVLQGGLLNSVAWAALGSITEFVDLEARVSDNEDGISTNASDISGNASDIADLDNNTVKTSGNQTITGAKDFDNPRKDNSLLVSFNDSSTSAVANSIARRNASGRLVVAAAAAASEAVTLAQLQGGSNIDSTTLLNRAVGGNDFGIISQALVDTNLYDYVAVGVERQSSVGPSTNFMAVLTRDDSVSEGPPTHVEWWRVRTGNPSIDGSSITGINLRLFRKERV